MTVSVSFHDSSDQHESLHSCASWIFNEKMLPVKYGYGEAATDSPVNEDISKSLNLVSTLQLCVLCCQFSTQLQSYLLHAFQQKFIIFLQTFNMFSIWSLTRSPLVMS